MLLFCRSYLKNVIAEHRGDQVRRRATDESTAPALVLRARANTV